MVCGIFPDQGSNHVPCIGRQILKHWTTREVPPCLFRIVSLMLLWTCQFVYPVPAMMISSGGSMRIGYQGRVPGEGENPFIRWIPVSRSGWGGLSQPHHQAKLIGGAGKRAFCLFAFLGYLVGFPQVSHLLDICFLVFTFTHFFLLFSLLPSSSLHFLIIWLPFLFPFDFSLTSWISRIRNWHCLKVFLAALYSWLFFYKLSRF